MKIAVVSNKKIPNTKDIIASLISSLEASNLEYDIIDLDNLKQGYDLVCSIGGDGTILKTARFYSQTSTPIMGINMGRLGFLSLFSDKEISQIGKIIKNGDYTLRERIMLKSADCLALNDIVIKGSSCARTSKFNLFVNDRLVSDYIADGIIVATPTGSTAYGLSAGGPILHPGVEAMVIVPICAHTMTARPLVVPSNDVIKIQSVDEHLDMACDGQSTVKNIKEVKIEIAKNKTKLVFPKDYKFYSVLRNKLLWGVSPVSEGENI